MVAKDEYSDASDAKTLLEVGYAVPPDVAEKVASAAAVTVTPAFAHICAMTWYVSVLSVAEQVELEMQELTSSTRVLLLQKEDRSPER